MGILEVLTVIFVIAKLVGVVDWSWVQVCIPMYIAIGIYVCMFILYIFNYNNISKMGR